MSPLPCPHRYRHVLVSALLCLAIACLSCEDGWQSEDDPVAGEHSPEFLDAQAIQGRFVLILAGGTSETELDLLAQRHGLQVADFDSRAGVALLDGRALEPALPLLEMLGHEAIVQWAEPDIAVHLDLQPNDWRAPMWAFHNTGLHDGSEGADIAAFAAWDETLGGGVVIALVDSGVDSAHTDLRDRLWHNPAEVPGNNRDDDDDDNGFIDDVHGWDFANRDAVPDDELGHGTSVAGLIVGRGNDGSGILGAAWGARLMVLKAMKPDQEGRHSAFAISRALRYALDNGAQVVAAALSTEGRSRVMEEAARELDRAGVILVTSSGNDERNLDEKPLFPACLPLENSLVVASSDRRDRLAQWSGYGRRCVDLAAPGVDIITAVTTNENGNRYGSFSGTSMSVPLVAAGAALAWSVAPELGAVDIVSAIVEGVSPLEEGADRVASGGRLDLQGAVNGAAAAGEVDLDERSECLPAGVIRCGDTVGLDSSDSNAATSDAMSDYPCKVGNYRGAEASWEFVAPKSGEYRWRLIDPVPTELDNDVFVLSAEDGTCRASACLDKGGYGANSVKFAATGGSSYYLVVDGYNGATGPFQARLECPSDD